MKEQEKNPITPEGKKELNEIKKRNTHNMSLEEIPSFAGYDNILERIEDKPSEGQEHSYVIPEEKTDESSDFELQACGCDDFVYKKINPEMHEFHTLEAKPQHYKEYRECCICQSQFHLMDDHDHNFVLAVEGNETQTYICTTCGKTRVIPKTTEYHKNYNEINESQENKGMGRHH